MKTKFHNYKPVPYNMYLNHHHAGVEPVMMQSQYDFIVTCKECGYMGDPGAIPEVAEKNWNRTVIDQRVPPPDS